MSRFSTNLNDEKNNLNIQKPFSVSVSQTDSSIQLAGSSDCVVLNDVENTLVVSSDGTQIEILESPVMVSVATAGIQGPRGEQGMQGPAGGPIAILDDLNDVILVNLQGDQTLRYNPVLRVWQNSSVTDGGNF
jgi:hypothetical protein